MAPLILVTLCHITILVNCLKNSCCFSSRLIRFCCLSSVLWQAFWEGCWELSFGLQTLALLRFACLPKISEKLYKFFFRFYHMLKCYILTFVLYLLNTFKRGHWRGLHVFPNLINAVDVRSRIVKLLQINFSVFFFYLKKIAQDLRFSLHFFGSAF